MGRRPGSWDANKQNSFATGTVLVETKLKLFWEESLAMALLDAENNEVSPPLADGEATLTIGLTSRETGMAFTCQDSSNTVLSTVVVNTRIRRRAQLPVRSRPRPPPRPFVDSRRRIHQFNVSVLATLATRPAGDAAGASEAGTRPCLRWLPLVSLPPVAAVVLTREREEEVERDIYEYCPACDGELEGTEDRCPHCSFNLKKARNQFHDCQECGESIPDLMENCAYCGAYQDVSSFFERRERRERRAPSEVQPSK